MGRPYPPIHMPAPHPYLCGQLATLAVFPGWGRGAQCGSLRRAPPQVQWKPSKPDPKRGQLQPCQMTKLWLSCAHRPRQGFLCMTQWGSWDLGSVLAAVLSQDRASWLYCPSVLGQVLHLGGRPGEWPPRDHCAQVSNKPHVLIINPLARS